MWDATYKLTSIEEIKRFLRLNLIDKAEYIKESFDCDDFAYALIGEAKVWAKDFGIVFGLCLVPGHAKNWFMDGKKNLYEVEPFYIAELADRDGRYEGEKTSSHSLMKHYAVIRTWVRWMYAQKIIENRVTDFVKPPRLSSRLPSILTDEEIDMLFEDLRTQNFRNLVIFELFLDTGMRLEEVASLSVDDVNIEGGWIRVIGKGDVEDIVPIGAKVSRDLFAYMEMHRKPAHESERSLFLSDHGPTTGYGVTYEAMSKLVALVS